MQPQTANRAKFCFKSYTQFSNFTSPFYHLNLSICLVVSENIRPIDWLLMMQYRRRLICFCNGTASTPEVCSGQDSRYTFATYLLRNSAQ